MSRSCAPAAPQHALPVRGLALEAAQLFLQDPAALLGQAVVFPVVPLGGEPDEAVRR